MTKIGMNFIGGTLVAALLCCGGCGQNGKEPKQANSTPRQANAFEMPIYSQIVNAYNDVHYKKNLGQDFNAIIGLMQGGKAINRDGAQEMDFCPPVRGKNDNLSWSFDLSEHEKELAETLLKDGDGYYRMKTEEYKAAPSEEYLHPVNPTIRSVNSRNEAFAVALLDKSSFPRCSAEVVKKIAPETADTRYLIMEKSGQTNDGEHSTEASAWKISENLYFLLTADFGGAWHPRTYAFVLYDGTSEPTDFAQVERLTPFGLVRESLLFFMDIGSREVRCGGIVHAPDSNWTTQIARNMCDMWDGFLLGKKFLIHDRDSLFNKRFDSVFESIGIEIKKLPPFTPQMNSRMENFIRAIKTECLDKIVFTSETQLRLAVKEYLEYWNHYRPMQGLGGKMVNPYPQNMKAPVKEVSFLGGLLHGYRREPVAA